MFKWCLVWYIFFSSSFYPIEIADIARHRTLTDYQLSEQMIYFFLLTSKANLIDHKCFFVGPPKDGIFLTTIYGLYFSHHFTFYLQITFIHI